MRRLTKIPFKVLGGLWIACLLLFFLFSSFSKTTYATLFSELSNSDFDRVEEFLNINNIEYKTKVETNSILVNKDNKEKLQNEIVLKEDLLSKERNLTSSSLTQSNISKYLNKNTQKDQLRKSLNLILGEVEIFINPFFGIKKALNPELVILLNNKKISVLELNKISKLLKVINFGIEDSSKIVIFSKNGSLLYDFYQKPRKKSAKNLFKALGEIKESNKLVLKYWKKELGEKNFLLKSQYKVNNNEHFKSIIINGGMAHKDSESFDSEYKDLSVLVLDKKIRDELNIKVSVNVKEQIFTENDLNIIEKSLLRNEKTSFLFSIISFFKELFKYLSIALFLFLIVSFIKTNQHIQAWPFSVFESEKIKKIFDTESNLLCAAMMKQMKGPNKLRLRWLLGKKRYNEIQKSSNLIGDISPEIHKQSIKYINSKY